MFESAHIQMSKLGPTLRLWSVFLVFMSFLILAQLTEQEVGELVSLHFLCVCVCLSFFSDTRARAHLQCFFKRAH